MKPSLHLDLAGSTSISDGVYTDMTWIGLYSPSNNSNFAWIDGTPMDYQRWADYQPDNDGGNEYCGQLLTVPSIIDFGHNPDTYLSRWNDFNCAGVMRTYVCKRPPS